jgi:hypothetical protein
MKSKDQTLLEEAYTKIQLPVNEQEGAHNEKVRVYIIVRPYNNELSEIIKVFFSEQMAREWLQGRVRPEAFKIKIYEQGPSGGIEIK